MTAPIALDEDDTPDAFDTSSNSSRSPELNGSADRVPRPVKFALILLVGCGAAATRLVGNGPTGFRAAVVIVVFSLVSLWCLHLDLMKRRDRTVAIALLLGAGFLLTAPTVGRLPVPLALVSLLAADIAMFAARSSPGRRRVADAASLALVALFLASLSWLILASNVLTLTLLALGGGLVVLHHRTPLRRTDRAIAALFESRLVAPCARSLGGFRKVSTRLCRRCASVLTTTASAVLAAIANGVRSALDRRYRPVLWSSLFVAVITAPIFWRAIAGPFVRIRGTNDIPGTIERVRWMELWPPRIPVPHPGWSLAVKFLDPILGESVAVTLILAGATGAATAVLITIGRSMWDRQRPLIWPLACALGIGYVLMESPAVFAPRSEGLWSRYSLAGTHARGQGYLPLHQWGTPTITMSMPFVFALFALLLLVIIESEESHERLRVHRRALLALTIVSTLVQPATTLAVAPAVPIYLLLSGRLTKATAKSVGWYFVVPGALTCLAQVWFLASNVSPWEQATWVWRPFWSWSYFGLDKPAYWTTVVFFMICLWAGGRRYISDPAVGLSLIAFCVAIIPFTFLEQTGLYEPEGDLGVPAMMAFILLFVSSLRFILLEMQSLWERSDTPGRAAPPWLFAAGLMLAVMFCAGVFDVAAAAGLIPEV